MGSRKREIDLGDCLCVAKYNPGLLRCVERGDQFRGNDPVYVLLVLLEGSKIGSKGSKGVTSPLSLRTPPPPPPAVGNKEPAGALMDETGEEGIRAVKFPLPFRKDLRGALRLGGTSWSLLAVGGSSWSWPNRC